MNEYALCFNYVTVDPENTGNLVCPTDDWSLICEEQEEGDQCECHHWHNFNINYDDDNYDYLYGDNYNYNYNKK